MAHDEKWRSFRKQFWLLPLAFVAAIGMTACAAVDEPTDGALTTEETVTTEEAVTMDDAITTNEAVVDGCAGLMICIDDNCLCVGIGSTRIDEE